MTSAVVAQQQARQLDPGVPVVVAINDVRNRLPARPGQPYPLRDLAAVDHVLVHYTAGSPNARVEDVATYQTGPNAHLPFPAIAYHLHVDGAGKLSWCHDFNVRTWGSDGPGWNARSIHICYSGDQAPNDAQLAAIRAAIAFIQQQLNRILQVKAHGETSSTSCPGPLWDQWRAQVIP